VAICYRYCIKNVDYETSHNLHNRAAVAISPLCSEASVSVRYDPKRPCISTVT
jgi:hypothetical protein